VSATALLVSSICDFRDLSGLKPGELARLQAGALPHIAALSNPFPLQYLATHISTYVHKHPFVYRLTMVFEKDLLIKVLKNGPIIGLFQNLCVSHSAFFTSLSIFYLPFFTFLH
jgi:hypothetical protein